MNNYEDRKLIPMPVPKPYNKMTDEELQKILRSNNNYNILIPALIETQSGRKILAKNGAEIFNISAFCIYCKSSIISSSAEGSESTFTNSEAVSSAISSPISLSFDFSAKGSISS